ncbi:SRPBCC family protein [Nocardioides acrostichi]|uniref:SRPBCC family protein n=1 Tax=Nocardioides acrostichi TaxID=2784339 RepID=A0A930Y7Q4_9ACTN|nr:SRPBCC family protein [Nocardioides acrostichi]MBF4163670.1 SRPBCC family protein [Nocardioides acrostichi]
MTRFSAKTDATAIITASREEVWALLEDPDAIASMTPFVKGITSEGEHWTWQLGGLEVLGKSVSPSFTEKMTFTEPERIEFTHDPPPGQTERSSVEGWYHLEEHERGCTLSTSLEITLDLPLPKLSSKAVTATMRGVVDKMGDRFSANLLDRLGAEEVDG